jgi:hypothetical protein
MLVGVRPHQPAALERFAAMQHQAGQRARMRASTLELPTTVLQVVRTVL